MNNTRDYKSADYGLTAPMWAALVLMMMTAIGYMFATTVPDSLYEHLKCGMVFVDAGHVVKVDPWSYVTADKPWLDYNWLFESMLAVAYNAGGIVGLCTLKLGLVLVFVALLYWHLLSKIKFPIYASSVLIAAMATLGPFLFAPRPHLMTAICFTLLLLALNAADEGNRKWLWSAPAVMALWCNSHGGWVSGLGIVAIWCAADVLQYAIDQKSIKSIFSKRLVEDFFLGIGCALAILVNPYGADLPMFLFKALGGSRNEFADWLPISISQPLGMMYVAWILFTIVVLVRSKQKKSLRFWALLLTVAVQPMSALRHLLLTIIGLIVLCAKYMNEFIADYVKAGDPLQRIPKAHQNIFASIFLLLSIFMIWDGLPKLTTIVIQDALPVSAVDTIKRSGVKGNMATMFDYGDYCIWHLYPGIKVSSDGRREAAYSQRALALNMKYTYGLQDWDELLKKYPTDLALVSKEYAAFALMAMSPDWQLCYQDGSTGIFAKKGSETAEKLMQAAAAPAPQLKRTFP